ncbi:MAG TPA: DNA circularization N-terminal domain-containing protein [Ktedonobacteraceae bacterium]|jgi:prophage DNA circulation protein
MADIFQVPSAWRRDFKPASFRGAKFHCEANSIESGRRIVQHEFPKKELPYAEDMGRKAGAFTLRGYCISYPRDDDDLFARDYRLSRDKLAKALNAEGSGRLILPFYKAGLMVVCTAYKLTEEDKFGGYCTFDMTFTEQGIDPQQISASNDTAGLLNNTADAMRDQMIKELGPPSSAQQTVSDTRSA